MVNLKLKKNSLLYHFLKSKGLIDSNYYSVFILCSLENIYLTIFDKLFSDSGEDIEISDKFKIAIIYFLLSGYSIVLYVDYSDINSSNFNITMVNIFVSYYKVTIDHHQSLFRNMLEEIDTIEISDSDKIEKDELLKYISYMCKETIFVNNP